MKQTTQVIAKIASSHVAAFFYGVFSLLIVFVIAFQFPRASDQILLPSLTPTLLPSLTGTAQIRECSWDTVLKYENTTHIRSYLSTLRGKTQFSQVQLADCSIDFVQKIDIVAHNSGLTQGDGFADYAYIKDLQFLVTYPRTVFVADLERNTFVKVYEFTGNNALWIMDAYSFYYSNETMVVLFTKPNGVGGTADDAAAIEKTIRSSCTDADAGLLYYSSTSNKVARLGNADMVSLCLAP